MYRMPSRKGPPIIQTVDCMRTAAIDRYMPWRFRTSLPLATFTPERPRLLHPVERVSGED
ncbi:MAG: hypothetical protein LBQ30_10145 [Treponema sp.]|nr:hypothetical protein [Treponema sp.]